MNFYNEIDQKAAAWLRALIDAGEIPMGVVDERSISDLDPDELRTYTQCHFFAGIGGWSLALRLACWDPARPVWTGSCPCQPFSSAGQRRGFADERHLWPVFHRLIAECQPPVVFGEQVASPDGIVWLGAVRADLEATSYALGGADLCAAGVGALHPRQRLWWGAVRVADAMRRGQQGSWIVGRPRNPEAEGDWQEHRIVDDGWCGGVANAGLLGQARREQQTGGGFQCCESGRLADADCQRHAGINPLLREEADGRDSGHLLKTAWSGEDGQLADHHRPSPPHSQWRDADWLFCRDEKWRPVEPGTFPLAHGIPARVGRLRGYGNAIVPQVAAEFIQGFADAVNNTFPAHPARAGESDETADGLRR